MDTGFASEFLNSRACVVTNSRKPVLLSLCESSDSSAVQHQSRSSSAEDLTRDSCWQPKQRSRGPRDSTSCWKRFRGEAAVHKRHSGLEVILLQSGKIAQQARACEHPLVIHDTTGERTDVKGQTKNLRCLIRRPLQHEKGRFKSFRSFKRSPVASMKH